jgi:hypothetical protein
MRDRVEAMGGELDQRPDAAGAWVTRFELPLTDPTLTDPAVADPAVADPAVADPAVADPAVADPRDEEVTG